MLAKRSVELNQHIEDLKKLEAYAVCARETFLQIQKFAETQSLELKSLQSSEKITNETFEVTHQVIANFLKVLKSIEENSVKDYYVKMGASEFIKKEMTDIVNAQALKQESQSDQELNK
ncbi:MAG: hypothetical protein EBU84_13360 [Actinobacteria bacterium]|nr:hypothetical protein [Actinomycetota bacterium]